MLILQAALFWVLPQLHSVQAVGVVAFLVLMCYGGGFGTMPAFAADYFGSKNVGPIYGLKLTPRGFARGLRPLFIGPIYGLMLTAWGCASAFGPLLIAHMREGQGSYRGALHVIAAVMAVSILL